MFSDVLAKNSEIWLAFVLLHKRRELKKTFMYENRDGEDDRGVVLPGTKVIGKPKRILKFIGLEKSQKNNSSLKKN